MAESIVDILKAQGIASAYAYRINHPKARPGSLEIWFSADATGRLTAHSALPPTTIPTRLHRQEVPQ